MVNKFIDSFMLTYQRKNSSIFHFNSNNNTLSPTPIYWYCERRLETNVVRIKYEQSKTGINKKHDEWCKMECSHPDLKAMLVSFELA